MAGAGESPTKVLSPGGRPIHYRGSEGWASRIISKSLAAGGFGAVAGVLIGAARGQPFLRLGVAVGTNFLVAATCFGGAQEISRELRASEPEHWLDCAIGGLASGALLGHFQGGRARALPMGILFAGVGTGLQQGYIQYREYRIRHFLSSLSSESESLIEEPPADVKVEKLDDGNNSWSLPDWFPIQMLSAEEAARRALEQERKRQQTLKKLQIGESQHSS